MDAIDRFKETALTDLPDEIVCEIALSTDLRAVLNLSLVAKRFAWLGLPENVQDMCRRWNRETSGNADEFDSYTRNDCDAFSSEGETEADSNGGGRNHVVDYLNKTFEGSFNAAYFNSKRSIIGTATSERNLAIANRAIKLIPREVSRLLSIENVFVMATSLCEIPREMCLLTKIQILDLSGNELESLPKEIGRLENLLYLNLDGNRLKGLPSEISDLKRLKNLYLGSNRLDEIPSPVMELSGLVDLEVCNNRITSIPEKVCDLGELTMFLFFGNPIESIPDGFEALMSRIIGTTDDEKELVRTLRQKKSADTL